jgi:8-oxo-dGTP diphosphatase
MGRGESMKDQYAEYSAEKPLRGVIGVLQRDGRFLLIRRAGVSRAAGMWCFPGGTIEPGETEPQALVREMEEEIAAAVEPCERLMVQTKYDGRLVLYWWSATLLPCELRANPAEVAEMKWLTPEEVRGLPDAIPGTNAIFDHIGL